MITAGIEYAEAGDGPAVIYLHGIGGGIDSFRQQLTGVTGYRNIAWNMPGYGRSVPGVLTFETLSNSLSELISGLDLGAVHLVGQSIGGMVALDFTIRMPEQVKSLSLIGTTPSFGGRDERFKDEFLNARLAPLEAGASMAEIAAKAAPNLVGPNADQSVIDAISAPLANVPERIWRDILECLVTFNRRADLGQITQPCCLIAGSHDQNAPARTMEKMAAKLAYAEYHLIVDAGHMINQEKPIETNRILVDFLQRADT